MRLLILLLFAVPCSAQYTYIISADSTKLRRVGGNNELILENGTRSVTGLLTNYGNGRTRFIKPRISGDTLFVGVDTILLGPSSSASQDTLTFIYAGQSNNWGATGPTGLDTAADSRVTIWNHAALVPAWTVNTINKRPNRTSTYNDLNGGSSLPGLAGSASHAFYFAKKLAREKKVYVRLINANADGLSISNWFNGTPGQYLDSITLRVAAAGVTRVDGFIWDQGESDLSANSGWYKERFDSIKQVLRRQTWFPRTTPIIVVGMPQIADGANPVYAGPDTLLRWFDRGDDLWVAYARTDSMVFTDGVHFNDVSIKKIGEDRIWQAWQSLPHRFAELYPGYFGDTSILPANYAVQSGAISESAGNWTMADLTYMTDQTNSIAANGSVRYKTTSTGTPVIGLAITNTNEYFYDGANVNYDYGIFISAGSVYVISEGEAFPGGTIVSLFSTNIKELKIERAGAIVKAYARTDDIWYEIYEYPVTTTARLYAKASASGASVLHQPKISIEPANSWQYNHNSVSIINDFVQLRWKARVGSTASSATPTINTDVTDVYKITALAANITSFTTNLTGAPNDGDILEIQITDNDTPRTLAFGASFVSSSVTIPATTVASTTLTIVFQYFTTSSYGNNKWVCVNYF